MARGRRPAAWVLAVSIVLLGTIVARSAAQAPAAKGTTAVTTLSGVYTTAQADRGEGTYMMYCVSCHPAVTYTGPTFRQNWLGRPLIDLYDWVSNKMPKNEPGTLTPQESVQVIAYILRLNRLPAGKAELPPQPAALRKIRIEMKSGLF